MVEIYYEDKTPIDMWPDLPCKHSLFFEIRNRKCFYEFNSIELGEDEFAFFVELAEKADFFHDFDKKAQNFIPILIDKIYRGARNENKGTYKNIKLIKAFIPKKEVINLFEKYENKDNTIQYRLNIDTNKIGIMKPAISKLLDEKPIIETIPQNDIYFSIIEQKLGLYQNGKLVGEIKITLTEKNILNDIIADKNKIAELRKLYKCSTKHISNIQLKFKDKFKQNLIINKDDINYKFLIPYKKK